MQILTISQHQQIIRHKPGRLSLAIGADLVRNLSIGTQGLIESKYLAELKKFIFLGPAGKTGGAKQVFLTDRALPQLSLSL